MLSRALILAAVAFVLGCWGAEPADAQNLEAGKPPSQIFSSTCSLCHKGPRGLLKSVAPGSLPGFLRQHYTTSTDMAAAMSAYVLSNGAANAPAGGGNLTKQGQEARSGGAPSEPAADPAGRGRKPPSREAARPDADGLPGNARSGGAAELNAKQKAAAERRAARLAAKGKAGLPPKDEARHEPSKDEPGKDEAARLEPPRPETLKPETPKPDSSKSDKSETARVEPPSTPGTRPDPVPAVTPAPRDDDSKSRGAEKPAENPAEKTASKPADVAAALPKAEVPSGPLTIDMGPAPAPKTATAGPPLVPAGKPEPPISR